MQIKWLEICELSKSKIFSATMVSLLKDPKPLYYLISNQKRCSTLKERFSISKDHYFASYRVQSVYTDGHISSYGKI